MASAGNGEVDPTDTQKDQAENVENEDGNVTVKYEHQGVPSERDGIMRRDSSLKTKSVLKQGHLRVKEDGQKVYKKTPSQAIMSATQLGIGFSVGRLSAKPERDVLMVDFDYVEKVYFPSSGSKETPSHKYSDFRFKSYAPVAFRFFREIFNIQPSDFLISLANEPIREISNPGASGSLFFVSNDDTFIVKTVQHKEATFLQKLLPGYYMNLHQNPRTLLPKFFGLYCYQSGTSNIRLTVMNNLLPSKYRCHMKFDLKGSTFKRKASKAESAKKSPTYKDLDFLSQFPDGIPLDADTYDAVIKSVSRDVRVLESFNIMDYSFLLGIHNIDQSEREKQQNMASPITDTTEHNPEREARRNEFVAALEAIQLNQDSEDDFRPLGGIPAKNLKGERLILFMGIIDILQSYRLAKQMEHGWKSLLTDGDTVSVHKPSFYGRRFLDFIKNKTFRRVGVLRGPSKRRSVKLPLSLQVNVKEQPGPSITNSADIIADSKKEVSSEKTRKGKVVTIVEPNETKHSDMKNKENEVNENDLNENVTDDTTQGNSAETDPMVQENDSESRDEIIIIVPQNTNDQIDTEVTTDVATVEPVSSDYVSIESTTGTATTSATSDDIQEVVISTESPQIQESHL